MTRLNKKKYKVLLLGAAAFGLTIGITILSLNIVIRIRRSSTGSFRERRIQMPFMPTEKTR